MSKSLNDIVEEQCIAVAGDVAAALGHPGTPGQIARAVLESQVSVVDALLIERFASQESSIAAALEAMFSRLLDKVQAMRAQGKL